jgi:integral membrane sensor domain MASE1
MFIVVAGIALVFELDRRTGSAPIQHLYYLPILFAAVRFRMRGGLTAAVAAIVLYHVANPHLLTFRYEESDIVQVALFLLVGASRRS